MHKVDFLYFLQMPRSAHFLHICCMFSFLISCQHIHCDAGRHSRDSMLLHLQLALIISLCTCSSCNETICKRKINSDMRLSVTCKCNDNIKVWELVWFFYLSIALSLSLWQVLANQEENTWVVSKPHTAAYILTPPSPPSCMHWLYSNFNPLKAELNLHHI